MLILMAPVDLARPAIAFPAGRIEHPQIPTPCQMRALHTLNGLLESAFPHELLHTTEILRERERCIPREMLTDETGQTGPRHGVPSLMDDRTFRISSTTWAAV